MGMRVLSWQDIHDLAGKVAGMIVELNLPHPPIIYGVPRGGIHAAQAVLQHFNSEAKMVGDPNLANVFVDDIVDSGATAQRHEAYKDRFGHPIPFFALVDKQKGQKDNNWWEFPWETMKGETGPEENITRILEYIGEDPKRQGLLETPGRVIRSYAELFSGYKVDEVGIAKILKTFDDGACDEMVLMKGIEFTSFCEHHMLPFHGVAHVGYVPNGKIVGLSKLARLVDVFARRLQVQERLTQQITKALDSHLVPLGSACVIEAKHMCMSCRGVMKHQSVTTTTSSLTGCFMEKPAARSEFMTLIRG
jgi:GTP cyclohydrolase I